MLALIAVTISVLKTKDVAALLAVVFKPFGHALHYGREIKEVRKRRWKNSTFRKSLMD